MAIEAPSKKARDIFRKHGGMLRTKDALRLGIHPRTLYDLRDGGELVPVARGLYRLATAPLLSNPDWIAVAVKAPRAVICLISALSYHELTTQVPHYVDIALPSHFQVPRLNRLPIRAFWFPQRAFATGIEHVVQDRVHIRIYNPEKTIADCFKYRHKIGLDIAVEALRNYRRKARKIPIQKILEYARLNRVERVMRPYLEAIL